MYLVHANQHTFFIQSLDQDKKKPYYFSTIFYFLSLLSSEISVILPVNFFLIGYFLRDLKIRKNVVLCLPYIIPFILYVAIRSNISGINKINNFHGLCINFFQWGTLIQKLIVWYVVKLINPHDILFLWDEKITSHYSIVGVVLFFVLVCFVYIYLFLKGRKNLSAFSTILLLTGFIPMSIGSFVYTYKTHTAMIEPHWFGFSSIGYFLLLTSFFLFLKKYLNHKIWMVLVIMVICLNALLVRKNNMVWANDKSYCSNWLITNRFNDTPRDCETRIDIREQDKGLDKRKYNHCSEVANLAHSYFIIDESETAINYYRMALEMDSGCIYALYGLGLVYDDQGDFARAEKLMLEAVSYTPTFSPPYEYLITYYSKQGKNEEAGKIRELMTQVLKQ